MARALRIDVADGWRHITSRGIDRCRIYDEFSYNAYLQLESETISATGATNLLTRSYDSLGRASGLSLDSDYAVGYAYDTYGRMSSVSSVVQSASSASSADYSYLPNSDLISGYTMGGLSVTRSYESHRNLLTSIENRFDTNTISCYSYNNDAGGRRVSVIQTGAAFEPVGAMFNLYRYNSRSELTSAERYFGSSTNDTTSPVGLQDWSYAFDNIGNRTGTMKANASANYTANALNQYTERSVHGSIDIIGSAETNVTVTVNAEEADRQGYYWSHRLTVDNLFNPIYTQVVVEAVFDPGTNAPYVVSSETGNVFVAASPEEFTYDDEGNLLSDGRFEYQWDCENRLIAATTKDGLPEDMPIVHVEFEYDYMSRRLGKTVYEYDNGITNWVQADVRSFVYDSWNLISETISNQTSTITNSYVWGLDLSGSLQSAGGIGGLLASYSSGGTSATSSVFTFDGNGNVSELISTNGTIAAHYEYSSFGETIVRSGGLADENPFRFSTKYFDDETGLAYYGYRYYSPPTGKWISDDPLMDPGSPAVMVVKEQILDALEIYARVCATVMLDEELPDEMRVLALVELVNAGKSADSLMRNEPEFWLSLAGNNWLLFCENNPVNLFDLLGLCSEESGNAFTEMYWNSLMRNPFSPYNVIWRHLGNPGVDIGQTRKGTSFSCFGGTVAPDVQGNITAGETLTSAYGAGIASFLFVVAEGANVFDPSARARGQLLEDAASSFFANYAGMGKVWIERPVHTTALTVATFTPIMPIALAVNWIADRLGRWSGGGGLDLSW